MVIDLQITAVAPTPQGTGTWPPLLQMAGHGLGYREWKNSKQETVKTVLTNATALTISTSRACRAKKVEGDDKNCSGAVCPPHHFLIRSALTGFTYSTT